MKIDFVLNDYGFVVLAFIYINKSLRITIFNIIIWIDF